MSIFLKYPSISGSAPAAKETTAAAENLDLSAKIASSGTVKRRATSATGYIQKPAAKSVEAPGTEENPAAAEECSAAADAAPVAAAASAAAEGCSTWEKQPRRPSSGETACKRRSETPPPHAQPGTEEEETKAAVDR